jgi:hypothetical protein
MRQLRSRAASAPAPVAASAGDAAGRDRWCEPLAERLVADAVAAVRRRRWRFLHRQFSSGERSRTARGRCAPSSSRSGPAAPRAQARYCAGDVAGERALIPSPDTDVAVLLRDDGPFEQTRAALSSWFRVRSGRCATAGSSGPSSSAVAPKPSKPPGCRSRSASVLTGGVGRAARARAGVRAPRTRAPRSLRPRDAARPAAAPHAESSHVVDL